MPTRNRAPNAASKKAIGEYALRLRRVHRDRGEPSLRAMASRMNRPNSRYGYHSSASSLHRAFQGDRLPSWELVQAMLGDGMGIAVEEILSDWLPKWIAVRDLQDPIPTVPTTNTADPDTGQNGDPATPGGDDRSRRRRFRVMPNVG